MKKLLTIFLFVLIGIGSSLDAQNSLFTELDKSFQDYKLESINTNDIYKQLENRSQFHNITLQFGSEKFELELWDSGLRSDNFILTLADGSKHKGSSPVAMKGYVNNDPSSNVRLTINEGFLYGYIKYGDKRLNIQPANYFDKTVDNDVILAYYDSDIIESEEPATCSLHKHESDLEDNLGNKPTTETKVAGLCYDIELALAADWLMFDSYGSAASVDNQMLGVLNDVQGNYDDEFADEINYVHVESWISNCNTCDPWTSDTDAGTILSSFTNWGPGGFSSSHDIGTLWTDRNLDGSTVGIAWLGTVCTSNRYNVCSDFTTSAWQLRVLWAHEMGHNWDCTHDGGSGFIMSPSVNNSNTWSTNTINELENHLASRWCLDNCANGTPPTAGFDFVVIEECVTGEVEFFDTSAGASGWLWTFPGGTPSTSTDQNPVVSYSSPGIFDVTLEASNGSGIDVETQFDAITINDVPFAEFAQAGVGLSVTFVDTGVPGLNPIYFWDFGDGSTSTSSSPVHDYATPGTYTVTMEVQNSCGIDVYADVIEVYDSPLAGFFGDPQGGCAPQVVQFSDLSYGNIVSWDWTFDGATPANSTAQNPSVTYNSPGTYSVTLEVSNPEGTNSIVELDYIIIGDLPTAGFTYAVNADEVTFTNSSTNASTYSWDFGDGGSSVDPNPVYTYAASGTYEVILEATNPCGTVADTQSVVINLEPVAQLSTAQATEGCAEYVIDFLDNSLASPTSWNWTFEGGNPATSTEQNPTVTYSNKGTYDVSLEVTNASGTDMITLTDYVIIDDVPTLSGSYTADILTVMFTSNYTNATEVTWDFGDGNGSVIDNPTHVYAAEGSYDVSVSATNDCGTVTDAFTVVISEIPTAGITSDVTSGCSPLVVNYMDNSSSNTTAWNWTFPGGTPAASTDQNPTVSYASAGNYDVTLEVSNASGSSTQTWTDYVEVLTVPTAVYDVNIAGNVISLDNLTPGTTAEWTISDGTSFSDQNLEHTLPSNGTYEVTLEVSNACGSDMVMFEVTIDAYPTSSFGYDQAAGCAPFTVSFEDSSINASSYAWDFPGGTPASSTDPNPVVIYNSAGSYDVNLTVTNEYGSESFMDMDAIVVGDVPSASFTSISTGSIVDFDNTSMGGNSYSWDFGDGNMSNMENPSHSYVDPGTYEVELTVTNDCGSTVITETIMVDFSTPGISASFSVTTGCAPLEVEITDNSSNDPTSWLWEFPGGDPSTSTDQNPKVTYNSAGTYTIMATISNADGASSFEFTDVIVVEDVPTADFDIVEMDGEISITNTTVGATSYSWDFGDGTTSLDSDPTHTYTATGTYNVTLLATNDCGTVEVTKTVEVEISSTNEATIFGSWDIFPNPTAGMLNINFEVGASENLTYSVVDVLGQKTAGGKILAGAKNIQIDLASNGTYFILLEKDGKKDIRKVIVIR